MFLKIYFMGRLIVTSFMEDLGLSLDSKLAGKELKVVTPEKRKACITTFTKKVGNNLPVSKTRSDHISHSEVIL